MICGSVLVVFLQSETVYTELQRKDDSEKGNVIHLTIMCVVLCILYTSVEQTHANSAVSTSCMKKELCMASCGYTVEPLNNGHVGTRSFDLYRLFGG